MWCDKVLFNRIKGPPVAWDATKLLELIIFYK